MAGALVALQQVGGPGTSPAPSTDDELLRPARVRAAQAAVDDAGDELTRAPSTTTFGRTPGVRTAGVFDAEPRRLPRRPRCRAWRIDDIEQREAARSTSPESAVTRASTPAAQAAAANRSPTICGESGTTWVVRRRVRGGP